MRKTRCPAEFHANRECISIFIGDGNVPFTYVLVMQTEVKSHLPVLPPAIPYYCVEKHYRRLELVNDGDHIQRRRNLRRNFPPPLYV